MGAKTTKLESVKEIGSSSQEFLANSQKPEKMNIVINASSRMTTVTGRMAAQSQHYK
jgi:hypothetical protein